MKSYYYILSLLCLFLLTASCVEKDEYKKFLKGGEQVYPARPDSITAHPGRDRVLLSWILEGDPNMDRYMIYWNQGEDSVICPITKRNEDKDTINVWIDKNVVEGTYTFSIYAFDHAGHRSLLSEISSRTYGDNYQNSLPGNRQITGICNADDSVFITWEAAPSGNIFTALQYITVSGDSKTIRVMPDSLLTILTDYKSASDILYRSAFIPDSNAIDTFYIPAFDTVQYTLPDDGPEKFEPADGKVLVFVGQELEAIGGLTNYHDGYFDHFAPAAGFTMYTNFMVGVNSYGHVQKGLDGLTTTDNWGDGPSNMSLQTSAPAFSHSCLAIGLAISQGNDKTTAEGGRDDLIVRLGKWIKQLGTRPVFLRIGYEFDGHSWNHYNADDYKTAFKRIRHMFDSMGVNNVAYVWQSKGAGTTLADLNNYYPGDQYVDWCAYSFFTPAEEHHPMIDFARDHHKPLMLAEASPVLPDPSGGYLPLDLSKPDDAALAWEKWFVPFFRTIQNNPDVIKAFSYINADWESRPMWKGNALFKNLNAGVWLDPALAQKWKDEITKSDYLIASDTLFNYLWH